MNQVGIKMKVSSDFGDPKVARESRGSKHEKDGADTTRFEWEDVLVWGDFLEISSFVVLYGGSA